MKWNVNIFIWDFSSPFPTTVIIAPCATCTLVYTYTINAHTMNTYNTQTYAQYLNIWIKLRYILLLIILILLCILGNIPNTSLLSHLLLLLLFILLSPSIWIQLPDSRIGLMTTTLTAYIDSTVWSNGLFWPLCLMSYKPSWII